MSKKLYPADVVRQAESVLGAWNQINSNLAFGPLDPASLTGDLDQAGTLLARMTSLETQLTDLRNQRDALFVSMWDKVKRVRAGVRGYYGDDASEYEMVGGTRLSERKPYTRRSG